MPSAAVRRRSTSTLFHAPSAEASVLGAVVSILTVGLSATVGLPARSETAAAALSVWPSPAIVLSAGALTMPERASTAVQRIFTSLRYQPLSPSVPPATAPVSVGAVLSMLIGPTVVDAELSALSTALAVSDWFAPSVETTLVPPPVQLLMPDSVSVQERATVTSLLFQPSPLACGLREAPIVGLVLSTLTIAAPLPALPRRSVAVAVFVTPAVSALCESEA